MAVRMCQSLEPTATPEADFDFPTFQDRRISNDTLGTCFEV